MSQSRLVPYRVVVWNVEGTEGHSTGKDTWVHSYLRRNGGRGTCIVLVLLGKA